MDFTKDNFIGVRTTRGVKKMIAELLKSYPDIYITESDVVRSGIIKLYKEKVGNPGDTLEYEIL